MLSGSESSRPFLFLKGGSFPMPIKWVAPRKSLVTGSCSYGLESRVGALRIAPHGTKPPTASSQGTFREEDLNILPKRKDLHAEKECAPLGFYKSTGVALAHCSPRACPWYCSFPCGPSSGIMSHSFVKDRLWIPRAAHAANRVFLSKPYDRERKMSRP